MRRAPVDLYRLYGVLHTSYSTIMRPCNCDCILTFPPSRISQWPTHDSWARCDIAELAKAVHASSMRSKFRGSGQFVKTRPLVAYSQTTTFGRQWRSAAPGCSQSSIGYHWWCGGGACCISQRTQLLTIFFTCLELETEEWSLIIHRTNTCIPYPTHID